MAPVRVTIKDMHIKVDGCVGQSFLRSYATLTAPPRTPTMSWPTTA